MLLIPFDRVTLVVVATAEVTRERLQASVGKPTWNPFKRDSRSPFLGMVGPDRFKITRNITYRNSFMPVLVGTISQEGPHTVIHLRLRLVIFVLVFIMIWVSMATFGALAISWRGFSQGDPNRWAGLLMWGFPAFGYVLCMGGFNYERKRSLKALKELLQATEV
jgi:hypothetical protein